MVFLAAITAEEAADEVEKEFHAEEGSAVVFFRHQLRVRSVLVPAVHGEVDFSEAGASIIDGSALENTCVSEQVIVREDSFCAFEYLEVPIHMVLMPSSTSILIGLDMPTGFPFRGLGPALPKPCGSFIHRSLR